MGLEDYRKWLIDKLISRDPRVTEDFKRLELSYTLIPEEHRSLPELVRNVILPLHKRLMQVDMYDTELQKLANENGKMFTYSPLTDSKDHINIYSKGRTVLGRSLSNFASIGFTSETYGKFESMEGFWYWLSTGMRYDQLRLLKGYEAKEAGRKLPRVAIENFKREIKHGLLRKIEQNPELRDALKESELPFTHYYFYGEPENCKIVANDESLWLVQWIEKLRLYVKGQASRVIIAGSREVTDYEVVKQAFIDSEFVTIEIVSGAARGVDTLGEQLSEELSIPLRQFPANWDKYNKAAGTIRNRDMGNYADSLVAIWDGKSTGTRNMIDYMTKLEKPVYVKRTDI